MNIKGTHNSWVINEKCMLLNFTHFVNIKGTPNSLLRIDKLTLIITLLDDIRKPQQIKDTAQSAQMKWRARNTFLLGVLCTRSSDNSTWAGQTQPTMRGYSPY